MLVFLKSVSLHLEGGNTEKGQKLVISGIASLFFTIFKRDMGSTIIKHICAHRES